MEPLAHQVQSAAACAGQSFVRENRDFQRGIDLVVGGSRLAPASLS